MKRRIRLTEGNLRRIVAEATMRVLAEAANPQYGARIAKTGRTQNSMADEYNQAKNDMFSDYYNFQNQMKQDYNQSKNQMGQGYNQGGQQANQNGDYERWNERNQKILKLREMGVIKNDNDEYLMRKKYNVAPTYRAQCNPHETW